MQKKQPALHEVGSQRKSRSLSLNRETIRVLDPALLELARGGRVLSSVDSCNTSTIISSDTSC
jgi:urease gamma subunit